MSRAGTFSAQGDEYQLQIGLHWLIRLLEDKSIDFIQLESTGAPGLKGPVTVDDVVIFFTDGRAAFIQAKKNQPQYTYWSLKAIGDELKKAALQLETHDKCTVVFYSRSPWGAVETLARSCQVYPDYAAFQYALDVPTKVKESLTTLSKIISRSEQEAFRLACSIDFGEPFGIEEWERRNLADLGRIVPKASLAMDVFRRVLLKHQASLVGAPRTISLDVVLRALDTESLTPTRMRTEAEILEAFKSASAIGRFDVLRDVGGRCILRPELDRIVELVSENARSVLLTSGPGSGKTCLMLDLADRIEEECNWGLLFIKGDRFADSTSEQGLARDGLPEDIVGQCARLSEFRKAVVLIDSLDVLSLSRSHGALGVFLGLIDRLGRLNNVTVVAACRTFDLTYDPMLQGRQWDHIVDISPLDFESVVAPLLIQWGVNTADVKEEMRELLCNPRNLSLFEQLVRVDGSHGLTTTHDLHDRYLEEVVLKGTCLGREAMDVLENMAAECMQRRKMSMTKAALRADEGLLQRLASVGAVVVSPDGQVSFHQTMGECLVVRHALSRGKNLTDFILEHPQLPFIRPAVRAYFFNLRAHNPEEFRRQVTAVLAHGEVLYHLKRLVSESLGEIVPTDDDIFLILRLYKNDPELFQRMLWHTASDAWLAVLTNHWLSIAVGSEDKDRWLREFAGRLRVWMNTLPEQIISLWRQILEQASEAGTVAWEIIMGLEKFEHWAVDGVEELLKTLVVDGEADHDFRLKPISRWVEATGKGDALLWEVITKEIDSEQMEEFKLGHKLLYGDHHFYRKGFIKDRLKSSDELLTLAVKSLETWCRADPYGPAETGIYTCFIDQSSWRYTHTQHDVRSYDDLECFFDDLEEAIWHRAKRDDAWWKEHEPRLRDTPYAILRYFLIRGYMENLEGNIEGLEKMLRDEPLFRYSQLEYKLGMLIRDAYPLVSAEVQEANQAMIHSMYADHEKENDEEQQWVYNHRYEYLIRIPGIFRTEQTQAFLDHWSVRFGTHPPTPQLKSWGGLVGAPVSVDKLLELSADSVIRLLQHYNNSSDRSETIAGRLVGGRGQVERQLCEAASKDPLKFIDFLPVIKKEELSTAYEKSIIQGVADHLKYRFGNLRSQNGWKSVEPLPDGTQLAKTLLQLISAGFDLHSAEWTFSRALEACCYVLSDEVSLELIITLTKESIELLADTLEEDHDDLMSTAINRPIRIMVEGIMVLLNNLLEADRDLPASLVEVLFRLSHIPKEYMKASMFQHLPFVLYKSPDLGWQLFDTLGDGISPRVWQYAERCLYYNYHKHFDRIGPCLDKIYRQAMEVAGETWGRIGALAYLSGCISRGDLFKSLECGNEKAWKGAMQVFSANIDKHDLNEMCHDALLESLSKAPLTSELMSKVSNAFVKEKNPVTLSRDLAVMYLQKTVQVKGGCGFFHFLDWLPFEAHRDPISALEILEALASAVEDKEDRSSVYLHREGIASSFMRILREADELDDPRLLQRVIVVQDRFLRMGLDQIEALYKQAAT